VLNNLTKTQDCVIFSKEDGELLHYFEGRGKQNLPEEIPLTDLEFDNIEDMCPGILKQLK
jgi:hypothetical protein